MRNFLSSFALLNLKQLEKGRISAATKREKKRKELLYWERKQWVLLAVFVQ
jgi:hypothetical protein